MGYSTGGKSIHATNRSSARRTTDKKRKNLRKRGREKQWSSRRLMTTLARAPDTHIHRHSRSRRAKKHENGNPLSRMQASTLSHYALAQSRIWQPAQLKDMTMINRHKNNVLDNERKCFFFSFEERSTWKKKKMPTNDLL
ncbi:hypothetical protein IscW_ISCW019645 [Ixodes scapularis]|uniref:Uncharacterized protein n=1 Tax=Ixodes scapularis TaxID=6945 RepID=B7PUF3_IXOSC|nr:hypothetical protein IscW_ISCW019645 [Ixodes scapularis]|eukprot:XP_002405975.1 hypothetical protein IscW_ISCW019645 [Ixodes scapularis]